jgi:hypothetical protein
MENNWMTIEPWSHRLLLKLALLWMPAAGLLWWLKLRKIRSVIIYFVSGANLVCYMIWVGAMVLINSPIFYRWSTEFKDLKPILYTTAILTFVWFPFVATVGSFILLTTTLIAKPGEHRFLVPANLLMFILWATSIIAPN